MATSGRFETKFAGRSTGGYWAVLDWNVNSQSTSNNSSNVTAKLYVESRGSGYTISSSATKTFKITINGTTYTSTGTIGVGANTKKLLMTKTVDVSHNSDGSKTCVMAGSFTVGFALSGTSVSQGATSGNAVFDKINLNTAPSLGGSVSTSPSGTIAENTGNISVSWNGAGDAQGNLSGYRVYRYINGGHNGTYWPSGNSFTDDISGFGQGTTIQYKVWAYDSWSAYSGEINSPVITKNRLNGAYFTGHSGDIDFNTGYFDLYYTGAGNTNGVNNLNFLIYSDNITIHNGTANASGTQRITIRKNGAAVSGPYIEFEDLKRCFKNNAYNGRLHVGIRTGNDYGSYVWNGGSVGVDLRVAPTAPTSVAIAGGTALKTIATTGNKYYIPNGSDTIIFNWEGGADKLEDSHTYILYQIIDGSASQIAEVSGSTKTYTLTLPKQTTTKTIGFGVHTKTSYGWTNFRDSAATTLHYYNPPTVDNGVITRTDTTATVKIKLKANTSIPNVNFTTRSFNGASSGTLTNTQNEQTISANNLTGANKYSWTVSVKDDLGLSTLTITKSIEIPAYTPLFSVREKGVGVNCIPNGDASLEVNGGLIVDDKIITKVVDEGAYRYGGQGAIDENFRKGMNDTFVYNNLSNGTVTITRINDATAPNDTKKILKITNTGEASPGHGGFSWQHGSYASGVWNYILVAKIPLGKYLEYHNNAFGDDARFEWISDNVGTGEWETYIGKAIAGKTGTFQTIGFFAVHGGSANFDWYLAKATYYEATSGALSATVQIDGVMEVGQYIDFHQNNNDNDNDSDYDVRLQGTNPMNRGYGNGNFHVACREATLGNNLNTFCMGYDMSAADSGLSTSKNNVVLGSQHTVWLKSNNFYDGSNDVHYNKHSGAGQLMLATNQYPKFRWSSNPDQEWGTANWSNWFEILTTHVGQQAMVHRPDICRGNTNLNDWLNSGMFMVSNGDGAVQNYPPNSYPWGLLVIFGNHHHGVITQLYFPHSNSAFMQYRTRWADGGWTHWANVGWSAYSLTSEEAVVPLNTNTAILSTLEENISSTDFYNALKQIITTTGKDNTIGILKETVMELNDNVKKYLVDETKEEKVVYKTTNEEGEDIDQISTVPATSEVKRGVEGIWSAIALQEEIKIRDSQLEEQKQINEKLNNRLKLIEEKLGL